MNHNKYIDHQPVVANNVPFNVLRALKSGKSVARFYEDNPVSWEIYHIDCNDKLHVAAVESLNMTHEYFQNLNYAVTDMHLHFRAADKWEIIHTHYAPLSINVDDFISDAKAAHQAIWSDPVQKALASGAMQLIRDARYQRADSPKPSKELDDETETHALMQIDIKINLIYDILDDIGSIVTNGVSDPKVKRKIFDKCDKIKTKIESFHDYIDDL